MKKAAVIMAGGKGERFWPKSRSNYPKQFLSLTNDGKTMIQLTAERLSGLVPYEDIFVITNENYIDLVSENLPQVPKENILAEPLAKNTAPAIGLAAELIAEKYGDAIMFVMPSDHLIKYEEMYIDTLRQAEQVALEDDNLMTIGITPTYPETGYGYINFGKDAQSIKKLGIYSVKKFVEKPDLETAKEYLSSGEYLWNSGMFVWKVSSILHNFEKYMPTVFSGLKKIKKAIGTKEFQAVLKTEYEKMPSDSIDYGIMEHAKDIYTIPGNFGWDDVGSWLALERINKTNDEGNMFQGEIVSIGTSSSIIVGGEKLIAAVGLEDVIIVDTKDAILICNKDDAQDIKKIIATLKDQGKLEYI